LSISYTRAHPPGDDHPTLGRRVSWFVVAGTSYFLSISPSLFSIIMRIFLSLYIVSTSTAGTGSNIIWYALTGSYKLQHTVPILLHIHITRRIILLLNASTWFRWYIRGSKIIAWRKSFMSKTTVYRLQCIGANVL